MTPDDGLVLADRAARGEARLKIIDCDVHHALRSAADLKPFLATRWQEHLDRYGFRVPTPFLSSPQYPKGAPALSRTDSWPPNGGPPGSDLAFLREQLLDRWGISFGLLHFLFPGAMDQRNQSFGNALARALNEWQVEHWTRHERRLKAGIILPGEDADAAVAEIEHWAGHTTAGGGDFVQVALATHTIELLGRRRYWRIYEAAAAAGLPLCLHTMGYNGRAVTPAGWPSFYVEEHHEVAISQQTVVASLILEGVLERIPDLKVVIVEAGFAWVPGFAWRLDHYWSRFRDELEHVTRPPSETIRERFWFTCQPADEPEKPEQLRQTMDWMGWDRLLFATDYPHWDMDNPEHAFRMPMSDEEKRMVFAGNAERVYGLS